MTVRSPGGGVLRFLGKSPEAGDKGFHENRPMVRQEMPAFLTVDGDLTSAPRLLMVTGGRVTSPQISG